VKLKLNSEPIRFKSKQNTVLLCDGVVEKHFTSAEAAAFEVRELRNLRAAGVRVPEVYALDGALIKMQYIHGETLPDLIARLETSSDTSGVEAAADRIISWLRDFYNAVDTDETGEIRGDINGRNFVFDDVYCWGVDFEEKIYGAKEKDIGRLLAFVLTYDPPGTPIKTEFADKILQRAVQILKVKPDAVCRQRDLEFEAMMRRRAKKL